MAGSGDAIFGGVAGGASQGAQTGAAAGPWGAAIGAAAGAIFGGISGYSSHRKARRQRRRMRRQVNAARAYADQRIAAITGQDTLFGRARSYLNDVFSDEGGGLGIRGQISRHMQSAQAARGMFTGNAAAAAEAYAVGAGVTNLRSRLAPMAANMDFMVEQQRGSIFQNRMQGAEYISATGTGLFEAMGGQILKGAAGGAQLGGMFQQALPQDTATPGVQGDSAGSTPSVDPATGQPYSAENPFMNPYGGFA